MFLETKEGLNSTVKELVKEALSIDYRDTKIIRSHGSSSKQANTNIVNVA